MTRWSRSDVLWVSVYVLGFGVGVGVIVYGLVLWIGAAK